MPTTPATPTRLKSFYNGLVMPVPGLKSIDDQIQAKARANGQPDNLGFFALGHMSTSYPLVVAICLAMYTGIDLLLSNRLF